MLNQKQIKNLRFSTLLEIKAATSIDNDLCYCEAQKTTYVYVSVGSAYTANDLDVLVTGTGGNTRWVGVSGKYINSNINVLGFNSLSQETVDRTIYLTTTGSDTTGDGTIGLPFYSIHRALLDIKQSSVFISWQGKAVTISLAAGSYDYSTLGNLDFGRFFNYNTSPRIYIKGGTDGTVANSFTVVDSGTFDAVTGNTEYGTKRQETGKAWVANVHAGRFMKIKTVWAGLLPTSDTSLVCPIYGNSADTLYDTAGGATTTTFDVKTYDICTLNTILNFGTNYIILPVATTVITYGVDITAGGVFHNQFSSYCSKVVPSSLFNCLLSKITAGDIILLPSKYTSCYIKITSSTALTSLAPSYYNTVFTTAKSSSTASPHKADDTMLFNSTFIQTGANKYYLMTNCGGALQYHGINRFIGFHGLMETSYHVTVPRKQTLLYISDAMTGFDPVFYHDNAKSIIYLNNQTLFTAVNDRHYAGDIIVPVEPSIGRMTLDNVVDAPKYYDSEAEINALAIATAAVKRQYISKTTPINLSNITTPSSLVDGDLWKESGHLYFRDNITTKDILNPTTDAVTNNSNVSGTTASDALNTLYNNSGFKHPVRCATTANITIATALNNGDVIDGITLVTDDRVLVWKQTVGAENGIYIVGVTPIRSTDYNSDITIRSSLIIVKDGAVNGGLVFQNSNLLPITINVTSLTFEEYKKSSLTFSSNISIYIDTTGNDITGDGSSGLPYLTFQRALKDIKLYYYNLGGFGSNYTITLFVGAGTYSMSELIFPEVKFSEGNITINIIEKNSTTTTVNAAAYVVSDSGTFSSNLRNVHTDASKTWTVDALRGKFVRVKTVNTGTMPTAWYVFYPIIRNGISWIETAYGYASISYSDDIATYDIVNLSVVLDLGNGSLMYPKPSHAQLNVYGISFTNLYSIRLYNNGSATGTPDTNSQYYYSCFFSRGATGTYFNSAGIRLVNSYVSHRSAASVLNGVLSSSIYFLGTAGYLRLTSNSSAILIASDCVYMNSSGKGVKALIPNSISTDIGAIFRGTNKFINFVTGLSNVATAGYPVRDLYVSGSVEFDNCDWFAANLFADEKSFRVLLLQGLSFTFINEPTLGRLSFDAVNVATEYYNPEVGLNCLAIAPTAYNRLLFCTKENIDVDTGTEIVDSFSDTVAFGCRWDFIIKSSAGTDFRAGSVIATWNAVSGSTPQYIEYSTADIGTTIGVVTLTVTKTTNTVQLNATVLSDNWIVRTQRYLI